MATKTKHTHFKALPKGSTGGVQLLLIQSVDHLGKQGDVVQVKRGFALNYLLPQGLATVATDHHKRMVEKHRSKLQEIEKARLKTLRDLSEAIAKQSITIEANANDEGHLFGSVSKRDIAEELQKLGHAVQPDDVKLDEPLRRIDTFTVPVSLAADLKADVKVWIVREKKEGEEAAKEGKQEEAAEEAQA